MSQKLKQYSEGEQDESESQVNDGTIEEEHVNWKNNVPFLYDIVITHKLEWPSLTVQWLPEVEKDENDNEIHRLIIGTNTSGTEQNYIKILQVVLPQTIDDTMDPTLVNNIRKSQKIGQVTEILSIPHASEVNRARFMPQATGIIAAWTDCGQIHVYDSHQNKEGPQLKLLGHKNEGYGLSWSHLTKGCLVSGGYDRKVALWDIESQSQKPIREFRFHKKEVEDVSWHSTNPNLFASCSDDCTMALIDKRGDTTINQYKVHDQEVNCISFSPLIEHYLITGSNDASIKMFDIRNPDEELHCFEQHEEPVYSLHWASHDKRYFASSSQDRRVMVWDIAKIGSEIKAEDELDGASELLFIHAGHKSKVNELSWNQSKPFVIASVEELTNVLQVWRMQQQRTVLEDEEDEQIILEELEM